MSKKLFKAGPIKIIKKDTQGNIKEIKSYKNIVTNVGLQMICNALIGSVDFLGAITYLAFGNGASSQPAAADIKLNAETYRKLLSLATRSDQTITLSCYLATTDGNGTYAEMGFFGNGAGAGADSGGLFNRVLITETKTSAETWTIEEPFTFENA